MRKTMHNKYAGIKRDTPLNIVCILISGAIPCTINMLMPTGGVIDPMVVSKTSKMRNQIGSYPKFTAKG